MTDVVGHVRQVTATTLTVENRHGELVTVEVAALVALKVLEV